jgi:hypothetical protein
MATGNMRVRSATASSPECSDGVPGVWHRPRKPAPLPVSPELPGRGQRMRLRLKLDAASLVNKGREAIA